MFDVSRMMKQASQLQGKLAEVKASLKERVVDASSGGGLVTAYVNGDLQLVKLEIDPNAADPSDPGMLEDLVVAAVNKALSDMNELVQKEMAKVTGGLGIPGLGL